MLHCELGLLRCVCLLWWLYLENLGGGLCEQLWGQKKRGADKAGVELDLVFVEVVGQGVACVEVCEFDGAICEDKEV